MAKGCAIPAGGLYCLSAGAMPRHTPGAASGLPCLGDHLRRGVSAGLEGNDLVGGDGEGNVKSMGRARENDCSLRVRTAKTAATEG
jgi:hypothetical protein